MSTKEVAYILNRFASWPRSFYLEEIWDFADSNIDRHAVRFALFADRRFMWLSPTENGQSLFIPQATLFRWFSYLSYRLAKAGVARLGARQLAMLMGALRLHGRWDTPPPAAVQFGQQFGFVGAARTPGIYVFPLAQVLAVLPESTCGVAEKLLSTFAEREVRDLALAQPLSYWLERGFSKFMVRQVDVVKAREGLLTGVPQTLDQIGSRSGVTRERIRQIEAKFWKKLLEPATRGPLVLPFLTGFLCDLTVRHGSLVLTSDSADLKVRKFMIKCSGIPYEELPGLDVIIVGHGSAALLGLGPTSWPPGASDSEAVQAKLETASQLCLVRDDLRLLSDRLSKEQRDNLNKSQKVYLALRSIGEPAHYSRVTEVYNLLFPDDQSTEHNVHATLGRNEQDRIVLVGLKGTFALREWGFEKPSIGIFDAVTEIVRNKFRESGRPVSFNVIIGEIGKYRPLVNPNSLRMAADLNAQLLRVSGDSFVPKGTDAQPEEDHSVDYLDEILRNFEEATTNDEEKGQSSPGTG